MPPVVQLLLLVLGAYFLGAVPFGYFIGKAKGIDVRTAGSGNIGATNVGRLLGRRWFFLVFALDALKGFLPMLLGGALLHARHAEFIQSPEPMQYALWMLAGLAVLLGHMFPVYLGFKGGKGVATSLGVMLGVYPYFTLAAMPALAAFLLTFALSRIISLSSILAAITFPLALLLIGHFRDWGLLGPRGPLLAFATSMAALVVFRHRGNIARLRAGTEPRFGKKVLSSPLAPAASSSPAQAT